MKKRLHNQPSPRKVRLIENSEEYSFENFFRLTRAKFEFELFNGRMSQPTTRISFERGDSAAVLLFDPEKDCVILVRQFRYPAYANLLAANAASQAEKAWLLEIVAGVQDQDVGISNIARKELLEEAGYEVDLTRLEKIATFFPSPGASSEKVTIYKAEVTSEDQTQAGGGIEAEGEDIQVVELAFSEAIRRIETGEICDGKTLIALQALALSKRP